MMEAAPAIGDNSKHFGEEMRAELETVLSDDHEAVFRYAQWHIGDYITGTNGMNLEAEGGYIRFLMRLYQRGKPLPDDDRFMAACMNLSLRVWKRIRDALVAFGKIIARNGCLTNARFEKERIRRAEEMKKKAEAANKRWLEKQEREKVSAKLGANLAETSSKHPANIGEKSNKINGDAQKVHMLTNNQYPEEEKERASADADGASPPSSRDVLWGAGLDWLRKQSPSSGDAAMDTATEGRLRKRMGRWISDYGDDAVLEALRKTRIAKPLSPLEYVEKILLQDCGSAQHVRWVGGRLEVANGFEVELGQILGGRDLRRTLDQISGKINVGLTGVNLENRVRALALGMVDREAGKGPKWAQDRDAKKARSRQAFEDLKRLQEAENGKGASHG